MKQNQNGNARRSVERIARLFDEAPPEELAETEQELRVLGLDPSTIGGSWNNLH